MIQIIEKTTQKGLVVLYLIFGVYFFFDLLVNYVDPCSELICTLGYPCFEQGHCSNRSGQ